MFKNWQQEKATTALVDEAQALTEKLASAKPHWLESHAAFAEFWRHSYLADGQDLQDVNLWKPAIRARFIKATEAKIAALRKQREYESSDGLTIWLHTARAVTEPRIAPAVRDLWQMLMNAGPNADAMADDLLQDADLVHQRNRRIPTGFEGDDA